MTDKTALDEVRAGLQAEQARINQMLKSDKSRRRGPMVRQLHEIRQMLDPRNQYLSQAGQDRIVDRFFRGKRDGTFLDIGGYDGITGSNTWFFEKMRGWTGALVEPVSTYRDRAAAIRSCICLGYAIADTDGDAEFIAVTEGFTQMSGLSTSYDTGMLERVRADPRHHETVLKVPTRTLSSIMEETQIMQPDFISLDIEGGELPALLGFPFEKHRVGAWAIENNTGTPAIANLMCAQGYELIEFCGPDEIYILPIS